MSSYIQHALATPMVLDMPLQRSRLKSESALACSNEHPAKLKRACASSSLHGMQLGSPWDVVLHLETAQALHPWPHNIWLCCAQQLRPCIDSPSS